MILSPVTEPITNLCGVQPATALYLLGHSLYGCVHLYIGPSLLEATSYITSIDPYSHLWFTQDACH